VAQINTELIHFYPNLELSLSDLCDSKKEVQQTVNLLLDRTDMVVGYLSQDTRKKIIGKGAFKTAHVCTLTLSTPPERGLGSGRKALEPIAVAKKRPYYQTTHDEKGNGTGPIHR
jgi:hypothetical protein